MDIVHEVPRQVQEDALGRHLASLPAPRHRAGANREVDAALAYLHEALAGCGWQVADQPCQDPFLGPGANLVATLSGTARPEQLVVVGAHHDTVPGSPGADDNGSGLAGLLELARLLSRGRWEATIQLVAFDFEETGFVGSGAYVAALRQAGRVEFLGAFILEMIGYCSEAPGSQQLVPGAGLLFPRQVAAVKRRGHRGDFLVALADRHGAALLRHFAGWAAQAAPDLPIFPLRAPRFAPLPDLYLSDHVPFWQAGLPAVLLTDTAYLRNPHYHRPSDRPETLDPSFWRRVIAATAAAVASLARPAT
jgi:acetylornithine deacetylase/succinyl-diaminopimelate desuccinylase-like protein